MKISVQRLFDDCEDETVQLTTDADTAAILKKTMEKLPKARKKRPLRLILIAAAAVAVLCGAAAVAHYASIAPNDRQYLSPDVRVYDAETGQTVIKDVPFEWDDGIRFDTGGKTSGKRCGVQLGWLPEERKHTGFTTTVYDRLAYNTPYVANALSDEDKALAQEAITYTFDALSLNDDNSLAKTYGVECYSADTVGSCDFLCGGTDTELVKEGMINNLYAVWVMSRYTSHYAETGEEVELELPMLFLYDPEKLCVVSISADWDIAEKIAAGLTIVETTVDTPAPSDRGFVWTGGVG